MLCFFDEHAYYKYSEIYIGLELGGYYNIWNKSTVFIKSTATGYNFLNLKTFSLMFKNTLYPIKPGSRDINLIPKITGKKSTKIVFINNRFRGFSKSMIKPYNQCDKLH